MGDVPKVLGMSVARDREKGTITTDQDEYTEEVVERFGMKDCNLAFTPGAGPEVSLNQPKKNLLDDEGKQQHQSIIVTAIYLGQVSPIDRPSIFFATWPGSPTYLSPTSKEGSSSPPFQMLTAVTTQKTASQHRRTS